MNLKSITDTLSRDVQQLQFGKPVAYVYNPLDYARRPYDLYLRRYGKAPKEILLVGMNPGPWGMAQTGIPFGEIKAVREWLGIHEEVGQPPDLHPNRPVQGFEVTRREPSGKRLWGWAMTRYG
ncbi:MAG: single-stranded DNA-binding protein, partial [Chitinivibrionales bacterium]|nr:single-stranded DNA-binding protein [Chitinivibrionales bacterium]